MIDAWITEGADNCLTERTMRMACGLPPMQVKPDGKTGATPTPAQAAQVAPLHTLATSQDGTDPEQKRLGESLLSLMGKLNDKGTDTITPMGFKYMRYGMAENTWEDLVNTAHLIPVPAAAGRKGKDVHMPSFHCHTQLSQVFPTARDESVQSFPEAHDLHALRLYLHHHPARAINVTTMLQVMEEVATKKTSKGRDKKEVADERKHMAETAENTHEWRKL